MQTPKNLEQCSSVFWRGNVGPFKCRREIGHEGKHVIIPGISWTNEEAVPLKEEK